MPLLNHSSTLKTILTQHLKRTASALFEDVLLMILLAALLLLTLLAPDKISSYPTLVDWSTIAALTGLLILTKGLEVSGSLQRLGRYLVTFMATERTTALCFVMVAAILSTLLTNGRRIVCCCATDFGRMQVERHVGVQTNYF